MLVPQTAVIALWLAARAHRPLRHTMRQVLGRDTAPPSLPSPPAVDARRPEGVVTGTLLRRNGAEAPAQAPLPPTRAG